MSTKQTNPLDRKTYILRLSPTNPEGGNVQMMEWRGQLQNVQSGVITPFQGIDALYNLLQEELAYSLTPR